MMPHGRPFHRMLGDRPIPKVKTSQQVQTVMGSLKRMLPLMWRLAPGLFLITLLLTLLQAAVPTIQVYLAKATFDAAALVVAEGPEHLGAAFRLLAIQAALALTGALLQVIQRLVTFQLQRRAAFHLDNLVAAKAVGVPLTFFDVPESYDQMQRASSGLGQRGLGVVESALQVFQNVLSVSGVLVVLVQFHWVLAVGVGLVAVPTLIINMKNSDWRFWQMRSQTQTVRKAGYLLNLLKARESAKEIRVFGLYKHVIERWRILFWKTSDELMSLEKRAAAGRLGADGVAAVGGAGAGAFLLWLGAMGRLTLGDYVALGQAVIMSQQRLQMTAMVLSRIYEDALFISDLFAFLDLPEEERPLNAQPFPSPLQQGIVVKNLSFSYPGSARPVLQDISFNVRPGEKIAIVGENGAGKTTLVKCLLGLYRPNSGSVSFDGIDVSKIDPADLRRHVTAVFQDFVRYQLTARENIALGRVEGMDDDAGLAEAAVKGGADEVIASLQAGLDTQLGPTFAGGQELSFGQWQKLALSRAFFRDAEVIALDEPTAALDPIAEAAVFERFARLSEGKTTLLVSHRLGTCRSANRILVLKDGRLVESGSHDELIAQAGEYSRMFQTQARWYLEGAENILDDQQHVMGRPGPIMKMR